MKYIKRFNESKEYHPYDIQDVEYMMPTAIDFDLNIIKRIKSILNEEWVLDEESDRETDAKIIIIRIPGKHYYNFEIFQSEDEWFYIRREVQDIMSGPYNESYNYYKCDQEEGLFNFLENYYIISKN